MLAAVVGSGATAAVAGVLGLLIGSFLNVVAWRVPRKESVVQPGSHCPKCNTAVRPVDNIPVLSWVLLRGRCRTCSAPIGVRYPLVELTTGVAFAVVGWRVGATAMLPPMLMWTACLVVLCVIDIDHQLLPNRVLYPSAMLVVPLVVLAAAIDEAWSSLGRGAAGAAIALAVFHALWFVAPKSLGYGDVRFSGLLGFVAGYYGWNTVLVALVSPFVLGSIGGIALAAPVVLVPMGAAGAVGAATGVRIMTWLGGGVVPADETRARITAGIGLGVFVGAFVYLLLSALRRVERGRHIPFGPYLALGAWLAVVAAA